MASFWGELKRRNVYKAGAAYVIVAWLVLQVASVVLPAFGAPDWVMPVFTALLALCFPLVLVFAWAYELTPAGLKRTKDVPREDSVTHVTGQKLNYVLVGLIGGAVIGSGAAWFFTQDDEAQRARLELIPEIERLIAEDDYPAAFALAEEALTHIPDDPTLAGLLEQVSQNMSISTTPPGADVYARPYAATDGDWVHIGRTSIDAVRVPQVPLRLRVELDGYEPVERLHNPAWGPLRVTLDSLGNIPPEMVRVSAGELYLALTGYNYQARIGAPDYLIDRYEVTNREYKDFVDANGYENERYWQHEFVEDGQTISWEDAMARFRDRTGRPGPATWEGGVYPSGEDDHPVRGVSWYEAAAYAEFKGKQLPTVYHWLGAAGMYDAGDVTPLANFEADGPVARATTAAMSWSGTYDMAGNVKEWAWNSAGDRRYTLGGGWQDAEYVFTYPEAQPPMERSAFNGFRCADYLDEPALNRALFAEIPLPDSNFDRAEPVDDATFEVYLSQYDYDQTSLDAVVDSAVWETDYWRRERLTFNTGYDDERMDAYIYLPLNVDPPYQTVVIFPSTTVSRTSQSYEEYSAAYSGAFDYIVQSGRAVVWPIVKSTFDRQDGLQSTWPDQSRSYSEHVIQWTNDYSRTLDYLETRDDIDPDAFAYIGFSWGGRMGAIIPAVEERLRAGILLMGGFALTDSRPEVSQVNFLPRVTIPVLMLNGSHDFIEPVETAQKPFFELLGTPLEHRRHVIFEGAGHGGFPRTQTIQEVLGWLDRYLGRVN